jgi:hypothetical protein
LIVVFVCLIAVALYRGWFTVSGPAHNAAGDKIDVKASVDVKKMEGDIKNVKNKIGAAVQQHERPGDKDGPPKPGPTGQ